MMCILADSMLCVPFIRDVRCTCSMSVLVGVAKSTPTFGMHCNCRMNVIYTVSAGHRAACIDFMNIDPTKALSKYQYLRT